MLANEDAKFAKQQSKANPIKVTQAQIREQQAKREEVARGKAAAKAEPVAYVDTELTENVNRLHIFLNNFIFCSV